jgi:hypothetical protein
MAPSAELFFVSADVDGEGVESDAWVLDLDAQRGEAVGFSSAGAMMCRAGRSACSQSGVRGMHVSNGGHCLASWAPSSVPPVNGEPPRADRGGHMLRAHGQSLSVPAAVVT